MHRECKTRQQCSSRVFYAQWKSFPWNWCRSLEKFRRSLRWKEINHRNYARWTIVNCNNVDNYWQLESNVWSDKLFDAECSLGNKDNSYLCWTIKYIKSSSKIRSLCLCTMRFPRIASKSRSIESDLKRYIWMLNNAACLSVKEELRLRRRKSFPYNKIDIFNWNCHNGMLIFNLENFGY